MRRLRLAGLSGFFVLLLALVTPVAAQLACAPDIVGPWSGKVLDEGRIKDLRTDFSTKSGALTGTYHVGDAATGYDGTLTDFTPSGPCAGRFTWHDRNGSGVVSIQFRPERDRFDGDWGDAAPLEGNIFTGRRYRPVPIS